MSAFTLSIIVPAFNRSSTIWSALTSIGQTIPDTCEIIVVDDGSTDGTALEAERALTEMNVKNSRIIRQENKGPGAARNLGAAHAKGAFFVFFDSDDLWFEHTLETLLETVGKTPPFGLIFLQSVDFAGEFSQKMQDRHHEISLFDTFIEATNAAIQTRFASCNVLVSRAAFEAVSGFDETLVCSEDTDLFLRAGGLAPTVIIHGTPMIAHRVTQTGRLSCDAPKVMQGFRDMIRKNSAGDYEGGKHGRDQTAKFLAGSAVYAVRVAFAHGYLGLAYKNLVQFLPLLVSEKSYWVWRLFLTPVLAVIRPSSYPFQWRPQTALTAPKVNPRDRAFSECSTSVREHWPVG